jgi:hypothetical protein
MDYIYLTATVRWAWSVEAHDIRFEVRGYRRRAINLYNIRLYAINLYNSHHI